MPAPVADERAGLREFLATQQRAFHTVAFNLTDEQDVFFKLIEELTRHAGHADIIRESIDGATLYELVSAHSASKEN
jgi:hypothetical protein